MAARPKTAPRQTVARRASSKLPHVLALAKPEPMPGFIEPEAATLVSVPPSGGSWLHEMKLDGYRGQIHLADGAIRFFTRGGLDWSHRFHALLKDARQAFKARQAIVDGEAVVMKTSGHTDFGALQAALAEGRTALVSFFVFDLLHLDGRDLRYIALEERKRLLRGILLEQDRIRYSDHVTGDAQAFYGKACKLGLEGVVSKRRGSSYRSGRTKDWLKTKCTFRQEFVIGGWRPSTAPGKILGSLLAGYYDGAGILTFAGKVGTGFNDRNGAELARRLSKMPRDKMPFDTVPAEFKRTSEWVEPGLVMEVEFRGWTRDDYLRHASFKGLREDKKARDVRRETAGER